MYIPITDDTITADEISNAYFKLKTAGYDFSSPVLNMLMSVNLPVPLILFYIIVYVVYPLKFGIFLLSAIPKKGNLKLLANYLGIHIQNLLSHLHNSYRISVDYVDKYSP